VFLLPLYWLLSPVLWILLPLIAIINPKVRHHWFHEKKTLKLAQETIQQNRKSKTVVLFHAASTGEFEQLKPVLNRIDRDQYFILLSFFSPTVFTSEKNTLLADAVCYHPFDFPWSARSFFRRLNIKYYIITRNDIWPTHLFIAKLMGIHTVLINANLYRKYHYTSWLYRSFFKQVLGQFNLILTSSERLKNNLLNVVSADKIQVSGDSRLDRVLERKAEKSIPLLPMSYKESRTLILGSIIPSDYPYIFGGLEKNYPNGQQSLEEKDHRIIIVPHEVDQSHLLVIEEKLDEFGFDWVYYSEKDKLENSRVVIIDTIGILADLYAFSDAAYVGAGFGAGVHSVIEPAVYENAVSFGPNFHIVDMAVSLLNNNLASVIETAEDFAQFCTLLEDKEKLERIREDIKDYILNQPIAAENITQAIFNHD